MSWSEKFSKKNRLKSGNCVMSFNTAKKMSKTMKWTMKIVVLVTFLHLALACGGGGASVTNTETTTPAPLNLTKPAFDVGDFMFIDVSAGAAATSYPISMDNVLPILTSDDENTYMTNVIVLKRVQAGSFMMGSSNLIFAQDNESLHEVTLSSSFYMGVYEVTQRQWQYVMGTNPSQQFEGDVATDAEPVQRVTYTDLRGNVEDFSWPQETTVDSNSFMGRLSAKTGLDFDLPTEAQWEYTCRAGTTSPTYSGNFFMGNVSELSADLFELGFFKDNNTGIFGTFKPVEVGSFLPNAWGFYDMHGNVWEWCIDTYQANLGTLPVLDPVGASSGVNKTVRGGYYFGEPQNVRSASRVAVFPTNINEVNGFRVYHKEE